MEISLYDDNFYINSINEIIIYLPKNKLLNYMVEQIINDLKKYFEYCKFNQKIFFFIN